MLLHAREGQAEFRGKVGDRSVCTPELLENAASSGVGERGERGIEVGLGIVNHVVQYLSRGQTARKARPSSGSVPISLDLDRQVVDAAAVVDSVGAQREQDEPVAAKTCRHTSPPAVDLQLEAFRLVRDHDRAVCK